MTKKLERIATLAEKQGASLSLRQGHLLSREELLQLKIQVIPGPWRFFLGILGIILAGFSGECFFQDCNLPGLLFGLGSFVLILFAVFGVRKTLGDILNSLDAVDSLELLGKILEGVVEILGSVFDGV